MHSQRAFGQNPPLPHHSQAHFYGAPELNFGLTQLRSDGQQSTPRSCCVFDSLSFAGGDNHRRTESVLLAGFHNGLDVFSVEKGRLDRIGRLENLRGSVIDAKILPSAARDDSLHSLRPLVVLVIHGPQDDLQRTHPTAGPDDSEDALFDPSGSMLQALGAAEDKNFATPVSRQTSVEVYSLRKGEHVATLLKTSMTGSEILPNSPQSTISRSEALLRIQANGRFIAVGSNRSGEVFIFESRHRQGEDPTSTIFKCIGKTWTSVPPRKPRSLSTSSTESDRVDLEEATVKVSRHNDAIFSLSHRWLAIVPPDDTSSAKTTIHADLGNSESKPPGLSSHTSPLAPQPTCNLDTPEGESRLDKLARGVTQEIMKGARWVGDQGIQAWKSYWNKPSDLGSQITPKSLPADPYNQQLPPTHAHDDLVTRPTTQSAIVSILDLEKLSESQTLKEGLALQPIASFALSSGCSLLSFTPSGLGLLTASAKGDVQHVWSLMRMVYGGTPGLHRDHSQLDAEPSVRQIARFTRMTVAKIVDVVWTEPGGERLALVTERGTVHIYDLPSSALRWPPPPRRALGAISDGGNPRESSENPTTALHVSPSTKLTSAIDMVTGKTQPFFAAVRGRPASIGNPFSGFSGMSLTAGAGVRSGKVVAAGFNKSVGAATGTMNTIRHIGENRLSLPGLSSVPAPGCVKWLMGKDRGLIAVTGENIVRIVGVGQSTDQKPGKRRPSVLRKKPTEFNIPDAMGNLVRDNCAKKTSDMDRAPTTTYGFWRAAVARLPRQEEKSSLHSQAEIDTNAPYQPFHTDRRIAFHVFAEEASSSTPHHQGDSGPWAFGETIHTTKLRTGSTNAEADGECDGQESDAMENHVRVQGNAEQGQQIVITTRRTASKKAEAIEDGEAKEIFEDDCVEVGYREQV